MEGSNNNWMHGDKIICINAMCGLKTLLLCSMFGKQWPLVFGNVYTVEEIYVCEGLPSVRIQEYPPISGEPICDGCHRPSLGSFNRKRFIKWQPDVKLEDTEEQREHILS